MAKDEEKNSQASAAPNEGEVKAKQEQTSAKEPAAKAGETEKVAALQKQVEELTKQLDDQKDQNLRAQAEMQNMTKRFKRNRRNCSSTMVRTWPRASYRFWTT